MAVTFAPPFMKYRITAILLIVAILSCSFSRFFVYAGFELNKKYITDKLCINRTKPWLHCNGKCYLMKKLKQAADKEKSTERENMKNSFQEAYQDNQPTVKFYTHVIQVLTVPNDHIDLPQGLGAIFRPPQLG
jgi:hypothetical protein